MKKPKGWATCQACGDKFFPQADKSLWNGITVHDDNCPDCGKYSTLIPLSDWYATKFNWD